MNIKLCLCGKCEVHPCAFKEEYTYKQMWNDLKEWVIKSWEDLGNSALGSACLTIKEKMEEMEKK